MKKKKERFSWRSFFVKGATRLVWRAVEMAILVALAVEFGFRIPKIY